MRAENLDAAHELELSCYPAEAAAAREAFAFRQRHFPGYFRAAWRNGALIGLACGVRTDDDSSASDGVKSAHGSPDAEGRYLCVLSVAVAEAHRGRGVAKALMEALIGQAADDRLAGIVLMCKAHLIGFYEELGFRHEGRSASAHGGLAWHEMKRNLSAARGD